MSSSSSLMIYEIFNEFLECSINQILCIRNIYPECTSFFLFFFNLQLLTSNLSFSFFLSFFLFRFKDLFERKLKYGIYIWKCKNKEINNYIQRFLRNSNNLIINVIFEILLFSSCYHSFSFFHSYFFDFLSLLY